MRLLVPLAFLALAAPAAAASLPMARRIPIAQPTASTLLANATISPSPSDLTS